VAIRNRKERLNKKVEIDLAGPEGNAHVLMAYARKFGKQLGYDEDHIERIINEMMLTNYEGLLYTLEREFGDYIILWR
jgi:hypothetical protein